MNILYRHMTCRLKAIFMFLTGCPVLLGRHSNIPSGTAPQAMGAELPRSMVLFIHTAEGMQMKYTLPRNVSLPCLIEFIVFSSLCLEYT